MMDRYFLKADHQTDWDEVSKEDWIKAERQAGFRPNLPSDHPQYMNTCATLSFCGGPVSGKIEFENEGSE